MEDRNEGLKKGGEQPNAAVISNGATGVSEPQTQRYC